MLLWWAAHPIWGNWLQDSRNNVVVWYFSCRSAENPLPPPAPLFFSFSSQPVSTALPSVRCFSVKSCDAAGGIVTPGYKKNSQEVKQCYQEGQGGQLGSIDEFTSFLKSLTSRYWVRAETGYYRSTAGNVCLNSGQLLLGLCFDRVCTGGFSCTQVIRVYIFTCL